MKSAFTCRRRAVLALIFLPAWVGAQEVPNLGDLAQFIRWGGVTLSIFVIAAAVLVLRLIDTVGSRLSARFAHRRPHINKIESIVRFSIYTLTVTACILLSVRFDSTALAVIGGALAVAIGFAMRDLVAALVAGITIMFDRPFQVGDRVSYAGQYGDVVKIGLRSVRLNTLDDTMVTIPNNKVLTEVTASGNYGALEMQVPMDFYIGVDQDVGGAIELIREACITSPYLHLERAVPVLARQTILENYVVVHLKARPYVFDSRYEKPFETDVHARVLAAFREHGIHPPAVLHRNLSGAEAGVDG